jgi:hypothetical protein
MTTHVWPEDGFNINLDLRARDHLGVYTRENWVFSDKVSTPQLATTLNTHTNFYDRVQPDDSWIRDINTESMLRKAHRIDCRDTPRDCQLIWLACGQKQSERDLYRAHHQTEIHSQCYPNIDQCYWRNITNARFNYTDKRI